MDYSKEILRLKKEKNALILAHNYQLGEVQDVADFVGDSLELAKRATTVKQNLVVMCGVDFMAEMVKLLNPEKRVLIPAKSAKCPMAAQLGTKEILAAKKKHPEAKVVLYVNSSASAKALADCCCTSANAAKVVEAMPSREIIFGPDRNLAHYVQKQTNKKIIPVPANGFCYTHVKFNMRGISRAQKLHPHAELLAHPECNPEVQEAADAVLSTSGMMKHAKESPAQEFIIATEIGMLHRLQKENPQKKFYPACEEAVCMQQKEITLRNLLAALQTGAEEIMLRSPEAEGARRAMDCMLKIRA
ncbi:MAG: quinolinate synthase NadA [Candidatus Diapherotrites archaeon]